MRIAVLGVGLIGGSIGLAARERAEAQVSGYDRDDAGVRAGARARRDRLAAAESVAEAVADAEAVFVAAPLSARSPQTVAQRARRAPRPTAWSATSARPSAPLAAAATPIERFVGGHPLAGAETAGVEHARADLFDGATWYLTPARGPPPGCSTSACTGCCARSARAPRRSTPTPTTA